MKRYRKIVLGFLVRVETSIAVVRWFGVRSSPHLTNVSMDALPKRLVAGCGRQTRPLLRRRHIVTANRDGAPPERWQPVRQPVGQWFRIAFGGWLRTAAAAAA